MWDNFIPYSDNRCTHNPNRLELMLYLWFHISHINSGEISLLDFILFHPIMSHSVGMVPLNYKTIGNC